MPLTPKKNAKDAFDAAVSAFQSANLSLALSLVNDVIRMAPKEAAGYHLRGCVHIATGNDQAALDDLELVASAYEHDRTWNAAIGRAYAGLDMPTKAKPHLVYAIQHNDPDSENLALLLAAQMVREDETTAAVQMLRTIWAQDPARFWRCRVAEGLYRYSSGEKRNGLDLVLAAYDDAGGDLSALHKAVELARTMGDTSDVYRRVVEVMKTYANSLPTRLIVDRVGLEIARGDHSAARPWIEQLAAVNEDKFAMNARAHAANYLPEFDGAKVREAAENWRQSIQITKSLSAMPRRGPRPKIGIISSRFCRHPAAYFLEPFLNTYDRDRADLVLIDYDTTPDDMTSTLKDLAPDIVRLSEQSPVYLAKSLSSYNCDVLISMTGIEEPSILEALCHRPAPIQMTAFGHFSTTGCPEIDYIVCDRHHVDDLDWGDYIETPLYMPDVYVPYIPPAYLPPITANKDASFLYGCFNNAAKICDETLRAWASILSTNSGARLLLKSHAYQDAEVCASIRARFEAQGGDPETLQFEGPEKHAQLLNAYNRISVALDPLAYSGGLTTLEALWMGVPVVTMRGNTFARRHSTAHLRAIGLDDLVAEDFDTYCAIGRRLADPKHPRREKPTIREITAQGPHNDATRYANAFLDAITALYTAQDTLSAT